MALVAYRHLLRSARVAFQGDARLLTAARAEARKNFESNRQLSVDSEEASAGITHANEVANILRHNIVQGKQLDTEGEKYQLRIHEDTERGDNESIKIAGPGSLSSGSCCSSRR